MNDPIDEFRDRLYYDWLPGFCGAPHRSLSTAGFKSDSISKLTQHDAHWFLSAADLGMVTERDGFFMAPLSKAKEQIFWTGSRNADPRPLTLWIEPIITIGALARLHVTHGWPIDRLGAQSRSWAFDLVGYSHDAEQELLACEVKKSIRETNALIDLMTVFGGDPGIQEPPSGKQRNAFKKAVGIRQSWPSVFWALGPDDYSRVFEVERLEEGRFTLLERDNDLLNIESCGRVST